jgi:uroporphyrinogen-III synthase
MKTILYLGTDLEHFAQKDASIIHYPVIAISPRSIDHPEIVNAYRELPHYSHLLFTSKNGVRVFSAHLQQLGYAANRFDDQTLIAIGASTAHALKSHFRVPDHIAEHETQEGLIALLKSLSLDQAYFFLPRSSLSRPHLLTFLQKKKIRCLAVDLYDTLLQKLEPIPDLSSIDEIVFTSPSTVRGFLQIFGHLPKDKQLRAIGPITARALSHLS